MGVQQVVGVCPVGWSSIRETEKTKYVQGHAGYTPVSTRKVKAMGGRFSHIRPNNVGTIQLWVNSEKVWDLGSLTGQEELRAVACPECSTGVRAGLDRSPPFRHSQSLTRHGSTCL